MSIKENLIPTSASEELSSSFLEYSMSVVYARAIPGIDGLKPVQRRIIFGMHDAGWTHDKNFVKVSRIAGEIMGRLHPHGDTSISDALVKLGQPFYSNVPLLTSYGNWGDISGSPAAAARYIEGKLSPAASYMLREINEDTVSMKPNYDGTAEEPALLPVMFPALLVNGNFGIGVGFSNKIPSHNLREVIDGTKALIRKPNIDLDELMKYIPGPDFPTGAEIIGIDGIKEAYETGRGLIRIRSKAEVRPTTRGKHEIVFTELPYGVQTVAIIEKIKDLLKVGKLTGLADAKDLTDRKNGLRIVVDVKAGNNPQSLLAELYRETALEDSFGINSTVIVNGEPKLVGLKEILDLFVIFRKDVVIRRSKSRKKKREDRLHIVEGLLKALANIDAIIKIVRGAEDSSAAQEQIMTKLKVDEVQADYILSIPLRRLTKYDSIQLNNEKDKLEAEINEINAILADENVLKNVIIKELDEVKKALGTDRKSVIRGVSLAEYQQEAKTVAATASEVEDAPCQITLFASGALTRSETDATTSLRGKVDPVLQSLATTTRGHFVAVTNTGRAFRVESLHLGENSKNSAKDAGISLKSGERIIALAPNVVEDKTKVSGLALGTKQGVVKMVAVDWPVRADEFDVISLADGDDIVAGRWVEDAAEAEFVFVSTDTSLLHFGADKVRAQGRSGGGVAGIKLADEQSVLSFAVLVGEERTTADVVTVSDASYVKRTPFNLYPPKGRATGGVRTQRMVKGGTKLAFAHVGADALLVSAEGKNVALTESDKRRDGTGVPVEVVPVVSGRK